MDPLTLQHRHMALSASEPGSVFVLKSLLYPVGSVLMLVLCLMAWSEPFRGPYVLIGVIAFVGTADLFDNVRVDAGTSASRATSALIDISLRWALLVVFTWAVLELCGVFAPLHAKALLMWAVLTPPVLLSAQVVAQRLLTRTGAINPKPRRAVIVGATDHGLQLETKLAAGSSYRIEIAGFFDDRAPDRLTTRTTSRLLGTSHDVAAYVAREHIEIVYITLPMMRHPRIVGLLNSLQDSTASIYFVPDLSVCELVQPRFDILNGVPVVAVCESPFYGLRGAAKRLTDITIAGLAVFACAPILLAVALGVRLSSPGPIVFKQRRYGLDGKEITVYKFRSMTVTEDGASAYTQVTRNDVRVTSFGSFIRATSLDELPQLFNVLEGSMSIVGPRPHAVAVNEQYRRLIPGYMVRHKVKPGITGWAQVNGFRGGDDLASMRQRIEFDLQYLQHWSVGLDFLIMLKTVLVIWNDRHAY